MKPRFNEEKTTQLACVLLKKRDGKMSILTLAKLMYLIDQASLLRWGWSMTGDDYASMPYGMVLSHTYDLSTRNSFPITYWRNFISEVSDNEVKLKADPIVDEISDAEMDLIDELYSQFGARGMWELVYKVHHNLPEWKDPHGSSILVPYEQVLEAHGKEPEEVKEILDEMEAISFFEKLATR